MKLSRATFGTIAGFSLILGLGACNADNDEPTMDETMMEESPMDDMATDEATEDMEDMEDGEAHGDGEHSEGADADEHDFLCGDTALRADAAAFALAGACACA